ncbi:MAG: VWA domain-containing protein [Hyphomicrobiaceae bacterium]|nr:MAG: VWA domain-containing protein [Hyphomicrobiaceae bacterium]
MPRTSRLTVWGAPACVLAAVLLSVAGAAAQGPVEPAVMFVLDGSGSMWGRHGREVKFYMARDALKLALPKYRQIKVGLTAFGHRRQGDCSDAETTFTPFKGDQERMSAFLDRFNPKGRGPVVAGLKAAAQSFDSSRDRPTIVLISDNADNCRADACAEARALKTLMPKLTIHAIALGVPPEEMPQFSCLAAITGGKVFQPEAGKDVQAALEEVLRLVSASVPAPAPAVKQKKAPEPAVAVQGLALKAVLKAGGEPVQAGLKWRVAPTETANTAVYEGSDPRPTLAVKPGKYLVQVRLGPLEAQRVVEVTDKAALPAEFVLNGGIINVKLPVSRIGALSEKPIITLYGAVKQGERPQPLAITAEVSPVYPVKPGSYVVGARLGLARVEVPVEIAAGTVVDLELPLYVGELQLSAALTEDGPPAENVFFTVAEDDPDALAGLREIVRSAAAMPEFLLPAGNYHLIARHGPLEVRDRVTVRAGAKLQKSIVLQAGRLTLSLSAQAKEAGGRDVISYRVMKVTPNPTQPGEEVFKTSDPQPTLLLQQGRYRILARIGLANAISVRDVEVRAGQSQRIEIDAEAGLLRLSLTEDAGSRTLADVFWEVRDRSGKSLWRSGQSQPVVALAPGRYMAIAEHRGRRVEREIEVRPGEDRLLQLTVK